MSAARSPHGSLPPTVSVVIPTYNRPASLGELLASLSRQTFRDFEVLVVNDAGAPIGGVTALHPELSVRVFDMPTNMKQNNAINRGIAHARGEFIMLCDDDDMLDAGHLARMVAAIAGHDLVFSDAEVFTYRVEGGTRIPESRTLLAFPYDRGLLDSVLTFTPSGTLYGKAIHAAIGPMDMDLPCYWDWDFFLRVADAGFRIGRVPVASVFYAFGENNCTTDHGHMRPYLERFMAKHGLAGLVTSNFQLVAGNPALASRRAPSRRVWDGAPLPSRLATRLETIAARATGARAQAV